LTNYSDDDSNSEEEISKKENLQSLTEPEESLAILHKLYHYFIKPFEEKLPPKFAIVAHKASHRIPWNFLVSNLEPLCFLVENHIVLPNPSVKATFLLKKMSQSKKGKGTNPLIVCNPTMPDGLNPLPGSENEGLFLQKYFGHDRCVFLSGDQATKDVVLKHFATSEWIHLATHCKLDNYQYSFFFYGECTCYFQKYKNRQELDKSKGNYKTFKYGC